ncbi:bifunctional 4-hydroxy-2-oxoglutarate aldolase/2-dehydro-3-deoxy-phosphogluconate aldolase [Actinoplanes sp. NPDC026619]|uniref:bifunctional 4-hydroxy-2-oxoglutarate aldolase/2-dehydro-3-deoxy-phosphogluconate aldolase n=1 Tax=Actinoplanes sp. NPDC026619 TaxID=3155798 RepID=UPI0033C15DF2
MNDFEDIFGGSRVLAILRGLPPGPAVALANRVWDAGVDLIEVPIQTAEAVDSLRAVVAAGRERGRRAGAGTVITPAQVAAAADAGAQYTVAPGLDLTVLAASLAAGLPHLPGVGTGSEVQHAWAAGCRWQKAFPAAALGPGWLSAMRGPFPGVRFVATGGLTVAGAPEFLVAGARVVALGSALADPDQLPRLAELLR